MTATMWLVLRLKAWESIQIEPAPWTPPASLTRPRDGSVGLLLVYATKAEAEAANPGAPLAEVQALGPS